MKQWNAEHYARDARFVADLGAPLLALLDAKPGERILDLGCGDGALTERIAASGATVVGFDASHQLLAGARARGLDVVEGDGQHLPFMDDFDAVFSNAALHWMRDAPAVASGVHRALHAGGRFVGEFGAYGNVAAIVTAMNAALEAVGSNAAGNPWFFPTTQQYAAILQDAGFRVESIDSYARQTSLASGMRAWLDVFADAFFSADDAIDRAAVFARAERYLTPALRADDGSWSADYVRLRFVARKTRA